MRRKSSGACLLLVLSACATRAPAPEELPAKRADVAAALYAQLDHVISRQVEIADAKGATAQREREELHRLADEIAVRIVRIDPEANVDLLVEKLERAR